MPTAQNEANKIDKANQAEEASGQAGREKEAVARPRRILRTLIFFAIAAALLIAAAAFFIRPYDRLERLAGDALSRHTPAGASLGDISVGFPLSIVMTDMVVPVETSAGRREISIKKLKGGVSVLSLLFGKLKVDLNADFFGGKLWLGASADMFSGGGVSSLEFDVRARGIDLGLAGGFLGSGLVISGRCDADFEGRMHERSMVSLTGQAIARGDDIRLPQIELDTVTLPENHNVKFDTRLSARDKRIFIERLSVDGSAYDVSGDGVIRVSEPFDRSPIDASFSVIFHEPPKISDMRLSGMNVVLLMESLVKSGAEIFFTVSGEINGPHVDVDTSSSLMSILESNRN